VNTKINIEEFSISKIVEAIETSQLVYGNEEDKIRANAPVTSREYLQNKHIDNPVKNSLVIQLVQKEQIRGHIFLVRRCFVFDSQQFPILVASDLVSKADFPGASLIIFRKALQQSKANNFALLNFSNKDSDKIYTQILKIKPVVELDFQLWYLSIDSLFRILIKPFKLQTNIAPIFVSDNEKVVHKNVKIQFVPRFDESIDPFFEKLEKEEIYFGKRSSKILNWRFNPSNEILYNRVKILKEGSIAGYLVVCERTFIGIRILLIVDSIICNLSTFEIHRIKREIMKSSPGVVACFCVSNLLHKNRALGKYKGLTIPRRFLPERVKFYLSNGDETLHNNFKKSHLTLFDTDIL